MTMMNPFFNQSRPTTTPDYQQGLLAVLYKAGYSDMHKIADTLQGQIWRARDLTTTTNSNNTPSTSTSTTTPSNTNTMNDCVIKITSRQLAKDKCIIINNQIHAINEDILNERKIISYLSSFTDCPSSIIKYKHFFKSNTNYYLVMENGGNGIFNFVQKAHKLIQLKKIEISDWLNLVRIIFKKLVNATDFLHSKNICHFDLSLENTLINDIKINVENAGTEFEKIKFVYDNSEDIKVKIVDFGLAEMFSNNNNVCDGEETVSFQSNKYCGKLNYQCPEIVNRAQSFDARSNDIWCLGVMLFCMITGGSPWRIAHESEVGYNFVINGQIKTLLYAWDRLNYFDDNLLDLLSKIFQFEPHRINLNDIKSHPWLNKENSN